MKEQMLISLNQAWTSAREHYADSQAKQKKQFDKTVKGDTFYPGQVVYLYTHSRKKNQVAKFIVESKVDNTFNISTSVNGQMVVYTVSIWSDGVRNKYGPKICNPDIQRFYFNDTACIQAHK